MKNRLAQRAYELGFDACRVTSAGPPESAGHFEKWLAAGRHGEMGYLARNAAKRIEPALVLSEARSIVTLAIAYGENAKPGLRRPTPTPSPGSNLGLGLREGEGQRVGVDPVRPGVIARYARFADYHDVLVAPLKQLAEFTQELGGPDTRSLWYADTGPLLERDLAQRAGLGFIGKHTNLISRRLGNFFFLAEIITTLALEPDTPETNRCGTCTRCISACPTAAIVAPFQLDARRCISYLTIELKGSIPVELRPYLGARIYGCDDCLEVCPWNRFAREARLMAPHARAELATPDLIELLALDDAGFKRRFAGTPMRRTKRRGLLRNVCVALGNVADARALPALEKASRDAEPLIAEHARWAIEQVKRRDNGVR